MKPIKTYTQTPQGTMVHNGYFILDAGNSLKHVPISEVMGERAPIENPLPLVIVPIG
jgi:hypothetical protein